mgnify:CR=1 FL=1
MAKSLPPLSRTLDKYDFRPKFREIIRAFLRESLDELRNIIRTQSLKKVKKVETQTGWQSLDSTVTIPEPVIISEPVIIHQTPVTVAKLPPVKNEVGVQNSGINGILIEI